jgi:soluble cytochrome b562
VEISDLNKKITTLTEGNTYYRISQNNLLLEKDELINSQKDEILKLQSEKEASVSECLDLKKL